MPSIICMEPVERGMVSQFAQENEIQQVIPAFVADSTLAEAFSSNGSYAESTITS